MLVGAFGFPTEVVSGKMFPGTEFGVRARQPQRTRGWRGVWRRRADATTSPRCRSGWMRRTSIGMALLVLGPVCRFQAAGHGPTRGEPSPPGARHGLAGGGSACSSWRCRSPGDWATQRVAAGGVARFHRRRGAGAARFPAAGRICCATGGRRHHVRAVAVRARREGNCRSGCRACCSHWWSASRCITGSASSGWARPELCVAATDAAGLHPAAAVAGAVVTGLPIPCLPAVAAAVRPADGRRRHQRQQQARAPPATITAPATCCWSRRWPRSRAGVCGGVAQTTPYIGQPGVQAHGRVSAYIAVDRRCSSASAACSATSRGWCSGCRSRHAGVDHRLRRPGHRRAGSHETRANALAWWR